MTVRQTEPAWAKELARHPKSGLRFPSHANVVVVLQHDPTYGPERIWYDEFLDRIFLANSPTREWRDDDDTKIAVQIQDDFFMHGLSTSVVKAAVDMVARQRSRHVIRDWLASLAWDGVPRIRHAFADCWGAAEDDYTFAASRNFFVGLVARILQPGCQLDTMVVFEGAQGIKKSMALRVLGGPWYATSYETVGSKDFLQGLRGKWLIEIAELQSFAKADIRAIKQTLSSPDDFYRKSHGHYVRTYPRECIFAGTTNVTDWGQDETGLRRFWPITCGEIRIDLLTANREQFFAEAVAGYRAGLTWWEMPAITAEVQAERQHYDAWTSAILRWCECPLIDDGNVLPLDAGIDMMTIARYALGLERGRVGKSEQARMSSVLKLGGWERGGRRRKGEDNLWLWYKVHTPKKAENT